MTAGDSDDFVTAMKAMAKRLIAENTWLRHSLLEIQQRVERMQTQLTHLETRAKVLRKTLATPATAPPAKEPPIPPTPVARRAARKSTLKKGRKP